MKKIILLIILTIGLAVPSYAQTGVCTNPKLVQSVIVGTASGTTTALITNALTDRQILVCNFTLTLVGAATGNQVTFEYGTGATCGTGTIALTGTLMAPAAAIGVSVISSPQIPFAPIPSGNNLCVVTTTGDKVTGVLTYILG